jgi:hypothetical protein
MCGTEKMLGVHIRAPEPKLPFRPDLAQSHKASIPGIENWHLVIGGSRNMQSIRLQLSEKDLERRR